MSNLIPFLTDLALNIKKQAMFAADPASLIGTSGLSEADKAALRRGDRASLTAALADELSTDDFAAVAGNCFVADPGPDPTPDPDPPDPVTGD